MISYLFKWTIASLLMPVLVILFGKALNNIFILFFWPSSIVLMSLGAEKRPWPDIVYTWSVAIILNVLLYLVIGLIVYYVMKMAKD